MTLGVRVWYFKLSFMWYTLQIHLVSQMFEPWDGVKIFKIIKNPWIYLCIVILVFLVFCSDDLCMYSIVNRSKQNSVSCRLYGYYIKHMNKNYYHICNYIKYVKKKYCLKRYKKNPKLMLWLIQAVQLQMITLIIL